MHDAELHMIKHLRLVDHGTSNAIRDMKHMNPRTSSGPNRIYSKIHEVAKGLLKPRNGNHLE